MSYNDIKKTRNDLEALAFQLNRFGSTEIKELVNGLSSYIPEYTVLLNEIGIDGKLHKISLINGIRNTQILLLKIKSQIFLNKSSKIIVDK